MSAAQQRATKREAGERLAASAGHRRDGSGASSAFASPSTVVRLYLLQLTGPCLMANCRMSIESNMSLVRLELLPDWCVHAQDESVVEGYSSETPSSAAQMTAEAEKRLTPPEAYMQVPLVV